MFQMLQGEHCDLAFSASDTKSRGCGVRIPLAPSGVLEQGILLLIVLVHGQEAVTHSGHDLKLLT